MAMTDKVSDGFASTLRAVQLIRTQLTALIGTKADLVGGKVPAGQLPTPPVVRAQATVAQVRAGKSTTTDVSPAAAAGAMAFTALTDAATVAINLDTGPNFTLTTTAGVGVGRTIGLPTNGNPGQFYTLTVTSDAAGRTLAWHTAFKWPKGSPKPITTTSGGKDKFSFQMINATRFEVVGFVEDIK